MKISIPDLSLVVLIGPSGAGKSTFSRKHFKRTEVVSSDDCRGLVSDDENDQAATSDAFDLLHYIAKKRLARGRLTVVDATNVQVEARKPYVALAREYHCLPVAIVLDVPERVCRERNARRPDRQFGGHVVRQQLSQLHRSLRGLEREGFRHVFVLGPEDIEGAVVERQPLWNDKRTDHGPFDVIGDVHGCMDELHALVAKLGYVVDRDDAGKQTVRHPAARKLVFLGDLVDRGPKIPEVLRFVMDAVESGGALCVPGNHEMKLLRKLRGKDVKVSHGLAETLAQLALEPPALAKRVEHFIDALVSHYVLDDGRLVVAHAGMKESMQGRGSGAVRSFALFGETTGETDEYGLPVRYPWAAEYRGKALVVYGHTPVPEAEWLNNTICVDTGCVFGGRLTALRYPERELVSVDALRVYCEPARPLVVPVDSGKSAQQAYDDVLDAADVTGKRIITTSLHRTVTVRAENAAAALEVMSRFAVDPRWLIYLPPTMSPCETSERPGFLEHPEQALGFFQREGIEQVICEEKHMGSRAVVIVTRSPEAARARFGVDAGAIGICYTRTGRRFFHDGALEQAFVARVARAVDAAGVWDALATDWLCLDCELMPWSAKAQELLREQYAAVAAAAGAAFAEATATLARAAAAGADVLALQERTRAREAAVRLYAESYRRYCWPVASLDDYVLAPFHILASEGHVHTDKDHGWHMRTIAELCASDARFLRATPSVVVNLHDAASVAEATGWWEALVEKGGEGMVIKPLTFIARGRRGLSQPALKCRGPEYLRIIYGPEYLMPENLERLRARGLSHKRSLALRELALGIEGLLRFVGRAPLRQVHECVFGVLALESEPCDPRL